MSAQINYNSFGQFGSLFTQVYTTEWEIFMTFCEQNLPHVNLQNELKRCFDPTGFWVDKFMSLQYAFPGSMEMQANIEFWPMFTNTFTPKLKSINSFMDIEVVGLRANLNQFRMLAKKQTSQLRLPANSISYGPFTEKQLEYLALSHPKIVEIGCGSGYGVSVFLQRGINAVGIDPGDYVNLDLSKETMAGVSESYPWSEKLRQSGNLIKGSSELLTDFSDSSLLLSWPEGGSKWPVDSLREYRECGGKKLLLKLGGYIGVHFSPDPDYIAPVDPGANIVAFFKELAKNWKQTPTEWIPELFENNLLTFELRTKPQSMGHQIKQDEKKVVQKNKQGPKHIRDKEKERKKRRKANKDRKKNRKK